MSGDLSIRDYSCSCGAGRAGDPGTGGAPAVSAFPRLARTHTFSPRCPPPAVAVTPSPRPPPPWCSKCHLWVTSTVISPPRGQPRCYPPFSSGALASTARLSLGPLLWRARPFSEAGRDGSFGSRVPAPGVTSPPGSASGQRCVRGVCVWQLSGEAAAAQEAASEPGSGPAPLAVPTCTCSSGVSWAWLQGERLLSGRICWSSRLLKAALRGSRCGQSPARAGPTLHAGPSTVRAGLGARTWNPGVIGACCCGRAGAGLLGMVRRLPSGLGGPPGPLGEHLHWGKSNSPHWLVCKVATLLPLLAPPPPCGPQAVLGSRPPDPQLWNLLLRRKWAGPITAA